MSAVRVTALLAVLAGCSERALPADRATIPPGPGQGGQTGGDCNSGGPGLELVGTPLLALDTPPVNEVLYTTLLWTGDQYLFVWRIINSGDDILMQRIDASGQGVGGNIRLRPYEDACDFAWGGTRLAAAWVHETAGQRQLMFQTFDSLGRPFINPVILRTSTRIGFDGSVSYGPRIVSIPGGFALAWNEEQVFLATVAPDGKLLQGPVAAGGDDLADMPQISLAASADRILVGWTARRSGPQPAQAPMLSAVSTRAFSTGLDPSGPAVALDEQALSGPMQVLAVGSDFLALWTHGVPAEDARVRIAQLDASGASPAIATLTPSLAGRFRDLAPTAWNADHLAVLWDRRPANATGLTLGRYLLTGGGQGGSVSVPTASPATGLYLVAHEGTVGFIWSEEIGGAYQVYFQQARACP